VKDVCFAGLNVTVHSTANYTTCGVALRCEVDTLELMTPDLISNETRGKF